MRKSPVIVHGHSEYFAEWVAHRLPEISGNGFGACEALGVMSGDKVLAGVVYHDYQNGAETMQLSMAADSFMWARRPIIAGLLSYPFRTANVFKAWIAVSLKNEIGLKTFKHIGFKQEAILAHQFGRQKHCVVLRMFKPDYERLYGDHSHG